MNYVDWGRINSLAVAQEGRGAVYISNNLTYEGEDIPVWEYLLREIKKLYSEKEYIDIVGNLIHGGLFFFDTNEERNQFYFIFTQELTESSAIYACLYEEDGTCITENT
jgi:hypothetical protein